MTATRTWEQQRLWAFVATWWQQIAITQAGIYLVASFGQGHNILPWWAAWGLAIGMEGTYLRGLIDAGHVRGRGREWATALIIGTYATIILWGVAYILSLPAVGVIPAEQLGPAWGTIIAVIHVIPVAYTGLCAAMLHRARSGEEVQRQALAEAEAERRQRELQDRLDVEATEERAARRRIELEAIEKRAQLAVWAEAQEVKRALRDTRDASPVTPAPAASGRDVTPARDVAYDAVVTFYRDAPPRPVGRWPISPAGWRSAGPRSTSSATRQSAAGTFRPM